MSRRRLEQSFAIAVGLLVVVLIGTSMFLVHSRVTGTLRKGLEARGYSIATSIGAVATPSLLAYNYAALQIAAEAASRNDDVVYVIIYDKEGSVAGSAGRVPAEPGEGALREVGRSRDVTVRTEADATETVLEVACPVMVEGVPTRWGTVRVGMSYAPAAAELRRIDLGLAVLGLGLAAAAIGCGRLMARRITAPLHRLADATKALSAGDMEQRIPVTGALEIAELACAFNEMMDRLREKAEESREFQRALELLNSTLEEQVRQRTRALEESETQYKTLVEHSPDSIFIVQHGRVRFANTAFLQTFGVAEHDVYAAEFELDRIFDPSSVELARGRIRAWERGDDKGFLEVVGTDASNEPRHLELRGSRIEYRGETAVECLLVDTTEARRLRERLNEAEKLRSLGELAGGVAHDFNNLLSAILGRTQLLRRKKLGAATDRELAVIEKAAQDGRETVRRIQEFSRMRQDKQFGPVGLREILRDSLEITRDRWKTEADRRKVSIDASLNVDGHPTLMGNAAELREVFVNVILNSADAMPQGGALTISARQEDDEVIVVVRDTGVGMTEEIRRHLFDPFFSTKGRGGMGLGMSVAYGIVTRHDGGIEVDTALGKGTTFTLRFPAAPPGATTQPGDGATMPELVRPGKILVVDDEPEVAELLRDVLKSDGHSVKVALKGIDAVKLAGVSRYDLVFTDLGMPDMSGWEVARRIRELRDDLPVVLVTGWGATLDEEEVRDAGIEVVVHKPFDIDEVLRATARLLSEAAGNDRTGTAGQDTRNAGH